MKAPVIVENSAITYFILGIHVGANLFKELEGVGVTLLGCLVSRRLSILSQIMNKYSINSHMNTLLYNYT